MPASLPLHSLPTKSLGLLSGDSDSGSIHHYARCCQALGETQDSLVGRALLASVTEAVAFWADGHLDLAKFLGDHGDFAVDCSREDVLPLGCRCHECLEEGPIIWTTAYEVGLRWVRYPQILYLRRGLGIDLGVYSSERVDRLLV